MPWKEASPMTERQQFIDLYLSGNYSVTELAERFGISRKTAYKYIERFAQQGLEGLQDRSRAPKNHPNRFDDEQIRALLIETRQAHPHWGPKMIRGRLLLKQPELELPAASTIGMILKGEGLVGSRRQRSVHPSSNARKPEVVATAPNVRWDCDYKGDFLLGNAQRCWPLTLTDGYSRVILEIRALSGTSYQLAWPVLESLLRTYGLPEVIRTDNGPPFAPFGGGIGLSRLTVKMIQLDIRHERTRPGSPQDNGQHERMHRTLKAETTRPPQQTMRAQQKCFDAFRVDFNEHRPHQGLDGRTPVSQYAASPRMYPPRLRPPEYPGHWEVRKVTSYGVISFKGRSLYIGSAIVSLPVGLVEIDDGVWSIWLYSQEIARVNERDWIVT